MIQHLHVVATHPGAPLLMGFLGLQISMPKIPIGTQIGNYVSNNVPGGAGIVSAVDTTIDTVKNAKLQPGVILTHAAGDAVSAAAASIREQTNASVGKSAQNQALAGLSSNWWVIGLVVVGLVLLVRKRG